MMKTYISILRGINVSGKNLIKMDALRKTYASLGFIDVKNYVQSGNVIFSAEEADTGLLEEKISSGIEKDFGFDVPVIVMSKIDLEKIVKENPFVKDSEKDPAALYFTFLAGSLAEFDREGIEEKIQGDEEIHFGTRAVYLYCPHGYGKTKLNNTFLERQLKQKATTRNWKTTNMLLQLAAE